MTQMLIDILKKTMQKPEQKPSIVNLGCISRLKEISTKNIIVIIR